jgi:LacI family transcriptional regulator
LSADQAGHETAARAAGGRRRAATRGDGEAGNAVTLKDVARAAEVHVSTASRALDPSRSRRISPATIARVQLAAERLGYMPNMMAKALKRGMAAMVGVVVSDLENPIFGPLIRGVSQELEKLDFVTLVTETLEDHDRFERALNHLRSRRVNAVITTAARTSDRHMLTRYMRQVPALVLAVRNISGSGIPYVIHDDRHGAELAAKHLVELGHRTVAQLRGPLDIEVFANRAEAFRRTVGAHSLIDVTVGDTAREVTLEEGARLMRSTLDENESNPPTAVFAHADLLALGAIEELETRGLRCPDDISILGYNDVPLAGHAHPPLSTVRLPSEEIGLRASRMVLDLLENPESAARAESLPVELILRASTGQPGDPTAISKRIRRS